MHSHSTEGAAIRVVSPPVSADEAHGLMCSDFKRGRCNRNYCRYAHTNDPEAHAPDQVAQREADYCYSRQPCRLYQRGSCARYNCDFTHMTETTGVAPRPPPSFYNNRCRDRLGLPNLRPGQGMLQGDMLSSHVHTWINAQVTPAGPPAPTGLMSGTGQANTTTSLNRLQ